jgi:tetratricopeptide (TPR) repeat protein
MFPHPIPLKIGVMASRTCFIVLVLNLMALPQGPAGEKDQDRTSSEASRKTSEPVNPALAPALEKWEAAKALMDRNKCIDSLPYYREALTLAPREKFPETWARIQMDLGVAFVDASITELGKGNAAESDRHQEAAISAYRSAQQIFTKEAGFPDWAKAQQRLAYALSDRETINPDQNFQAEGVSAMRELLCLLDRQRQPAEWSEAQTDLGNLLVSQAESAEKMIADPLLAEAETALQAALEVRTRESMPEEWGVVQCGIGDLCLIGANHGNVAEKLEKLKAAKKHYLMALEVFKANHSKLSSLPRFGLFCVKCRVRNLKKGN